MSTETTLANEWVASYLDALLSSGLSSEHIRSQEQQQQRTTKKDAEDESQNIAARYYVHQILSLDEDHIRDAWAKANRPSRYGAHQAVRDARMEHLSWRVWTMKRRRAEVQAAMEADRKEAAADLLRTQGMEEEAEEMEATTRQTIDELNSSTIAAFQECGLADAGAFGSVAFEALPEGLESILMENATLSQKSTAGDAKDDSSAAVSKATAGLPFNQQAAAGKAPILSLAAAKAAAAGAGRGPPSPDSKDPPFGPLPPTPFATGQVSEPQKFTPAAVGAVPPSALAGNATPPSGLAGVSSATHLPSQQPAATADPLLVSRFPRLYVILISLHGLVRGEKMELGKDPDTGGQVKYVVELAKSMAQFPSVARVDLLTRLICDPKVDKSYGEPEERLLLPPLPPSAAAVAAHYGGTGEFPPANATAAAVDLLAEDGSPKSGNSVTVPTSAAPTNSNGSKGAFIVRLQCGNPKVYLRKEDLWPHTREFADRAIAHAQATLQKLQESGEGPCELYVVHGHYADAGEVAAMVSSSLGADCVLTGHSLGRNKKEHLLKSGNMSTAEVEATYRISRRIEAEERALDAASVVFTSTQQEVAEQWGTYDGYSDQLSAALQLRPCKGYHVPRMAVIPPGLDFSNLKVSMPQDPWEEVLGTCPLPQLAPAGGSGVAGGMRMNGIHGTPPLSPRGSNLPGSSPRISPNNSQQPSPLPAPSEAGTVQGSSFNSTVPPAAAESTANISFMVCPNDGRPCYAASQPAAGKGNSSPIAPGTPASVLSSTPLTPTAAGNIAGSASNPLSPNAGLDSKDNSKPLGQLKINVPGVMVAAEGSHVPANGKHGSSEQKNGKGLADAEAAFLALPDGLDLSANAGNGTALQKRKSTSGLGGHITPPNSFTGRPSVAGNNGNNAYNNEVITAPSRRQSHIGAEGNRSVAATPRSPGPHNFMGIHPGKMNPRVLAAMMVGESEPAIWKEINRFLRHPGRPVILAMSRPDAKKNILALVRAYGQNRVLRDLANLVLIMGNRDVIDGMAPGSARVLNDVLKLVDTYDLYGQVAYPKKHSQADISDIYLLAAATRGVFVNIALQEPFGLTLIEAAAHGAPIVATKNGGPVDIVRTLENGVLVEPTDANAIAEACVSLITSQRTWEEYSDNGRNNITAYSWPSHCARYLRTVQDQKASNPNRMPQYGGGAQDSHAQAPTPRIRHTLSLSYDDLSTMARAIANTPGGAEGLNNANKQGPSGEAGRKPSGDKDEAGGASPTASSSAPWLDDLEHSRPQHQTQAAGLRIGSMPPQSTAAGMTHMMHNRGNGNRGQKTAAAAGDAGKAEGNSGFQAASMTVVEEQENEAEVAPTPGTLSKAGSGVPPLSTHPVYLQPRLTQHEQFVVFNIDTLADVKSCAPLIRALVGGGLSTAAADGSSSGWSDGDLQACMNELLRDRNGARPLGVGVLCTWSAKDMRALLSKEGVNPLSLDFMVCNAGALIWHAMASDGHQVAPASAPADDSTTTQIATQQQDTAAKAGSETTSAAAPVEPSSGSGSMMQRAGSLGMSLLGMGRAGSGENVDGGSAAGKQVTLGGGWMCDDQWERHVDFRWDDRVVLQVLRRILDNKTGWGKLHIVRPTPAGTTAKHIPQPAGTTAVHLRMSPKCTPYHYMVDVDVAGSIGGRAPLPPNEVAQQLLAAVRRKLRMCGVRAQLTMTPREALPSSNDASSRRARGLSAIAGNILNSLLSRTASNAAAVTPDGSPNSMTLHITPLRCTRPLALRHLATKFKKPLDSAWTLVACTTTDATPASVVLSTTDGEDLLGGVQKVTLVPTAQPGSLGFPVDVSVFGTVTTTQQESEKAAARLRLFATTTA